jgi:DNA-binding NarL/FixJ family response regulator
VEAITTTLEPLLKDAHKVGRQFEAQLKEKQEIARRLNEHLDSHIISLNLLLNRAELCLVSGENTPTPERKTTLRKDVYDLQQEIITLSEKGLSAEKIANRLGIAEGEVTLVLDLKKKFRDIEQA